MLSTASQELNEKARKWSIYMTVTCNQALFSFLEGKLAEREEGKKEHLIYLFNNPPAAPKLRNLSTAMLSKNVANQI